MITIVTTIHQSNDVDYETVMLKDLSKQQYVIVWSLIMMRKTHTVLSAKKAPTRHKVKQFKRVNLSSDI